MRRTSITSPSIESCGSFLDHDENATRPATVTPTNSAIKDQVFPPKDDFSGCSAEEWVRASCALRDNPSLMTGRILILALRNQPPLHAVRFMLSLNEKAAGIPKTGPTPLQVAVQHNASIEVIQCLLQACPFALCVTNPDNPIDPLSYAKRYRNDDKELIELLSRPISYWISERTRHPEASVTSFRDAVTMEERVPPPPEEAESAFDVDRHEFRNVKILCAKLLKGHRRLAKQVATFQDKIDAAHIDKAEILKELHEQQKKQFFRQLIALDMKEKAMRAYVDKTENRCIRKCEEELQKCNKGLKRWKDKTEDNMQEWRVLLEHEMKINAHFRNDLSNWMDEQFSDTTSTPYVFATPMGELNDEVPLCPKKAIVGVKAKAWKPFLRQWDRTMLK